MSESAIELPLGYWQPAIHFVLYADPLLACLCILAFTAVRRRRPPVQPERVVRWRWLRLERPGDGLFAAEELGPVKSSLLSTVIMALLIIPWLAFAMAIVLGLLMSAVESWEVDDGVPYLQYGLSLLMHKSTTVAPVTTAGRIWSLFIALFAYIFMNVILGFASMLRLISTIVLAFPSYPVAIFLSLIFLVVPLVLTLLALMMALVLVVSEGVPFFDGFLVAMDFMTTGGNLALGTPPTSFTWPEGILLNQICIMSVMALGGTVIGVLGGHPTVSNIMTLLEGTTEVYAEDAQPSSVFSPASSKDMATPEGTMSAIESKSKLWQTAKSSQVVPESIPIQESEVVESLQKRLEAMEARALAAEATVQELREQLAERAPADGQQRTNKINTPPPAPRR